MRSLDWSATDIGAPGEWPLSLRGYVAMILEMPTPAILFWGPNHTQLYNDGYAAIMGPRHPKYLGQSYAACWPETYPVIHPWMRRVLARGEVLQVQDELFTLTRHGFAEEAYFTFTFSPLRGDSGEIAGVFQPVVEVTEAVLAKRRTEALRELAALVDSPEAVTRGASRVLAAAAKDIPLSALYLRDDATGDFELAAHSGGEGFEAPGSPFGSGPGTDWGALLRRVGEAKAPCEIDDLERLLGRRHAGCWPEPTRRAYAVPLMRSVSDLARGVVVFGLSPRLHFGPRYREFLDRAARELGALRAVEQAKALERDLLERERAARREAELQKDHLVALIRQAPTPMVVLRGPSFVIEIANPDTCRVWMREEAKLVGRPLFEALPELRTQIFEELLQGVYATGETFVGSEVRAELTAPDGGSEVMYFNFVYAPLRGVTGAVEGILGIAVDVSEQVRTRTQIEHLKSVAEAASRAKDEFLAVLGHELRNPLAPILTALQLMKMRPGLGAEREREVIERQANHLVRLVDDLLDVSRVTSGKVRLKKTHVEVADVVARAVEMAQPILESRKHELVVDLPADAGTVHGDGGRLAQALANLLTNAAKYTEVGGRVGISVCAEVGHICIRVKDTGIGIEPERLPKVFDAFVQEKQALDRSQGGLGLGLAIVRGIVELHGGSVEARSEGRGKGSQFVLRLPTGPGSETLRAGGGQKRAPASAGRVCSILVVDDGRDAVELLAESLQLLGHRVLVAYDGPEALRVASQTRPDVALLDIGLPVMDGYELARRLRELPGAHRMPLVALTGYGHETDRNRSRRAGFDAHLVKPIDLDELHRVVQSLVGHRSEIRDGS